jgi:2-iminobutanoate/2-iminopropanoate deaminase
MAKKKVIQSALAPKPVASYAQAIKAGKLLFLSGQIGIDPATSELVEGGLEPETRRTLENLRGVLAETGATFADVVKCTVYLTDMANFRAFDAIFSTYFQASPTARATVAVSALPRGASIEIDAIALLS